MNAIIPKIPRPVTIIRVLNCWVMRCCVYSAITILLKPMTSQQVKKANLPECPGVYVFRDQRGRPLYIGKATILKDRVKSYFGDDLIDTRGPRIVDMVTKAKKLTWQETGSVLEALILESALIKKYQPYYNVDERDDKSSLYVVITDEPWPRVFLERVRDLDHNIEEGALPYKVKAKFGPFVHSGLIKESLKIIRKIFPFKDKKANDPRHEAFYRAIGRSPQSSTLGDQKEYAKTINRLILFFEGKRDSLLRNLASEMKKHIKALEFEKAHENKKLLYALNHINDMALLKREKSGDNTGFRIEAYDIAHLSGTNVVGAMVVCIDGENEPSEYRKFKISRERNNDVVNLVEIIGRRLNHAEWPYPDLMVVDGNDVQKSAAEAVLKSRRINIPVVAVTKDSHHKADRILGGESLIGEYKKEIISANAEAHRFTIKYHRQKRAII